jgi:hypothetical protein
MVSNAAREISGLDKRLTLGSLVTVRITTSVVAYFFISVRTTSILVYSALTLLVALLHPPEPCVPTPL